MPPRIRVKLLSGLCVYTDLLALVSVLFCGNLRVHKICCSVWLNSLSPTRFSVYRSILFLV